MGALNARVAHVTERAIKEKALFLYLCVSSAFAKVAHSRDQYKTENQKGPKEGPEQSYVGDNSEPEFGQRIRLECFVTKWIFHLLGNFLLNFFSIDDQRGPPVSGCFLVQEGCLDVVDLRNGVAVLLLIACHDSKPRESLAKRSFLERM